MSTKIVETSVLLVHFSRNSFKVLNQGNPYIAQRNFNDLFYFSKLYSLKVNASNKMPRKYIMIDILMRGKYCFRIVQLVVKL